MKHSIENRYVGELRTSSTHIKSGKNIITDAPVDNNGRGISEIRIEINFEKNSLTDIQKRKLMLVGKNCPVAKSLNSDIKQTLVFNF